MPYLESRNNFISTGKIIWKSVKVNEVNTRKVLFKKFVYVNDSEMRENDSNNGTKTGQ